MKKILFLTIRIIAVVLVVAIVFGLIYCVVEWISGRRQLHAEREKLEAEGLLRPLTEITPYFSVDALENGKKLLACIGELKALSKERPVIEEDIEVIRIVAPGIAKALISEPTPIYPSSRTQKELPKNWEEYRERLERGTSLLSAAKTLLKQPMGMDYNYASEKGYEASTPLLNLERWLRAETILKIHDGNVAGAIDDMTGMQQVVHMQGAPGTLTLCTIKAGGWMFCMQGLFWEILQMPTLTESDLIQLNEIARSVNFMADASHAIEIELAMTPLQYQRTKNSKEAFAMIEALGDSADGIFATDSAVWVRNKLWRFIWADGDEARTLVKLGESAKCVKQTRISKNSTTVLTKLSNRDDDFSNYDRWRFPLANLMWDTDATQSFLKVFTKIETYRQMNLAAIALDRYRLKNKRYPDELGKLVPDYLEELPCDWFDGKPLKFHLLDGNHYLLYSVGKNGIDDGGDAKAPDDESKPSMSAGRDMVWPRAEKPGM